MNICRSCGGVLGRDCWNEQDCMQISNSYDNYENHELIKMLQYENSVLMYLLNHNKINVPDFRFSAVEPLVLMPIVSCENKYIDDELPF
jgi:hypothetical protein